LEARLVNLAEYREKHPELEVRGHSGSLVGTRKPKGLVVGEIE
jgi:alpha-acetolactate decarboxylase